jgi:hypothetical protein
LIHLASASFFVLDAPNSASFPAVAFTKSKSRPCQLAISDSLHEVERGNAEKAGSSTVLVAIEQETEKGGGV